MPTKTIYIAEDDLPLYQRAQELSGGSLSAAIAQALRRFVESRDLRHQGFREVTLRVGPPGGQQRKRFHGLRLGRWRYPAGGGRQSEFSLYRTARNRLALYVRDLPGWAGRGDPPAWDDPRTWSRDWWEEGGAALEVFDDVEQLRGHVPAELYPAVVQVAKDRPVEDLDI